MWAIIWRIFKDRRTIILIYLLISLGLLFMYIALFPSFSKQTESLEALIKNYPESFLKAFNFDIKSFTTIEGFLSTEQFSFMWPLLMIFVTVGLAASYFAGEIEKGTIELLLSQPISRLKLFISRYIAGLIILIVFVLFSIYAAIPLIALYNLPYHANNFFSLVILGFLFGLAIYSIAVMLSAIFSDKGKVFFISGGILVLMYVLNIVSALRDSLVNLKYASFFYYFNPANALVYNKIDDWAYLVFVGLTIFCTILAAIIFKSRDVAVS